MLPTNKHNFTPLNPVTPTNFPGPQPSTQRYYLPMTHLITHLPPPRTVVLSIIPTFFTSNLFAFNRTLLLPSPPSFPSCRRRSLPFSSLNASSCRCLSGDTLIHSIGVCGSGGEWRGFPRACIFRGCGKRWVGVCACAEAVSIAELTHNVPSAVPITLNLGS